MRKNKERELSNSTKNKNKCRNGLRKLIEIAHEKHEIDVNRHKAERIKRWINSIKEFEKRIGKILKNEIRRYLEV